MKLVEFQIRCPVEQILKEDTTHRECERRFKRLGAQVDYSTVCKWRQALCPRV
jgi:hypothetical protein